LILLFSIWSPEHGAGCLDALSLEAALHCWRLLSGLGRSPAEFGCVQLEVLTTSVILGELPF